jgi:RimJ/RimL family protein N-acetyltransferase
MKDLIKKIARILLGEYTIFKIVSRTKANLPPKSIKELPFTFGLVTPEAIANSSDELIRKQAYYHGTEDVRAYACFDGERIVGVAFCWFGDRYRTLRRNFWPLASGQAKLVQIITLPEMCGKGIATALYYHASKHMLENGFSRIYARIWHSNTPSLIAAQRAGWKVIGTVIEIYPLGMEKPLRISFGEPPQGIA